MMNDRFSVNLRRHLVETANERPAEGQLAAVLDHVADTPQRHPLVDRLARFPERIGPFPPMAVRWALLAAALLVAATAVALLGSGGDGRFRSTVFEGTWTSTDPGDGSRQHLVVAAGLTPTVHFVDDRSTGGACVADEVKVFTADGAGIVTGSRLAVSFLDGGSCGLMTVDLGPGFYDYHQATDTLTASADGLSWSRVEGDIVLPTRGPLTKATPAPTAGAACTDLTQGGTYTAPAGSSSISVTATIPGAPATPWRGLRDVFVLSGSCGAVAPMTFFVSAATSVNDGGCMPSSAEISDFADAIARLDTPQGNDISDRIDLTIDGHPAARYDISNLSTCSGFGLWSGTIIGEGETGSVYVIDVDGVLLEIELNRDGSQTAAELEEVYAIVASLQFAAGGTPS